MAAAVQLVSKEQAFLETYFQCLQKGAYDKAKELSDKEKETLKTLPVSAWSILVHCLGSLATTEKTYSSLIFLTQNLNSRIFGRKDALQNLRTSYNCLLLELRKIEEGSKRAPPSGQSENSLEQLFGHLSGQLCQYITARIRLAEFYEQMLMMSQTKYVVFEDISVIIDEVITEYQNSFHHPILSPIKSNFSLECDILNHLIKAQVQLQEWQFLQSLLLLNDANSKLLIWESQIPPREVKSFGFGVAKSQTTAIYDWLQRFKGLLVAKFGLYFYDVLSKHSPANEVKNLMSKTNIDFYARMVQFQKRTDAVSVSLILDATESENSGFAYVGFGYHHPDQTREPLKGMDCYPTIFCYPTDRPERLWPGLISLLTSNSVQLDSFDRVVYFCDEVNKERRTPVTYYLARVEPRITLAILYEAKKAEKDSYITNFITEMTSQLRGSRLCATLKPGVK